MKTLKEIVSSKTFSKATWVVAGFLVCVIVFAVGVRVGERRAHYSSVWGQNYERNFMNSRAGFDGRGGRGQMMPPPQQGFGGMMQNFGRNDFRNAHGISGQVVSVTDNNIVVKDRDNKENTISTTDKTLIKRGGDTIGLQDLKAGDNLVIVGNPGDNGTVIADLVRVFNK